MLTTALVEGHRRIEAPPGAAAWDVDPFAEDILRDPADYYRELRDRGPVVHLDRYAMLAVGRYAETRQVFSDHESFVSSRGVGLDDFLVSRQWRPASIILEVDPPFHTRTRTVMARALSPKAVRALGDGFRAAAETLAARLAGADAVEAVTEVAEVFPVTVFPAAVGMTEVNTRHLVDYGACLFNSLGPDNRLRRDAAARVPEILRWIMESCARERLTPDGFGAAFYAAADAGEISHDEAGLLVRALLSAGVDTTVTGIGNALWCFSRNPGEWGRLRADPSLVRPAIEEVLRFTSPVHSFGRTAGRATEIGGIPVEEGTKVLCVLGAANLDPRQWGDPETFRIDRRPTGHLAFGAGIHGCVGQNVARAEIEALLLALLPRVKAIEPAGDPVWRPNNAIHALDRLPLRFIPT